MLATVAAVSFAGTIARRSADVADQVIKYDRLAANGRVALAGPDSFCSIWIKAPSPVNRLAATSMQISPLNTRQRTRNTATPHLPCRAGSALHGWRGQGALPHRGKCHCLARRGVRRRHMRWRFSGQDGDEQWIVIAGLTGSVRLTQDATEVEDIFKAMGGSASDDAR